MAERKNVDIAMRVSIWEVHGKRCAFTQTPIEYPNMQIDHVIPLDGGEEILAYLQKNRMAPPDFDLNGLENLLPATVGVNRQKWNLKLGDEPNYYYLTIARTKKHRVEEHYKASVERDRLVNTYLKFKIEADKKDISTEGLLEVLAHQVDGDVIMRVTPDLDGAEIFQANAAYASSLMHTPLSLGGGGHQVKVSYTDAGPSFVCETPSEFIDAKNSGAWPQSQYDINIWLEANRTAEMLRGIAHSKFATQSSIRYPRVTLEELECWSSKWVIENVVEAEYAERFSGHASIKELADAGLIQVSGMSQWSIEIDSAFLLSMRMSELIRADLDGDGDEEILMDVGIFAREGTLRAGTVLMAKFANGLLEPVEWEKPVGAKD